MQVLVCETPLTTPSSSITVIIIIIIILARLLYTDHRVELRQMVVVVGVVRGGRGGEALVRGAVPVRHVRRRRVHQPDLVLACGGKHEVRQIGLTSC